MTTNQARQFEMLQRVRVFAEHHQDLLSSTLATECLDAVARSVDDIAEQRVAGMSARRDGSGVRTTTRRDLEQRLLAISRAARLVSPDAKDLFRLPRPRSDQRILTTARTFLHNIDPIRNVLRGYNVSDESIAALVVSAETFAQALDRRRGGRMTHASATARIQASLDVGVQSVRTLDVIVRNSLAGRVGLIAAWDRARKVDYSRRTRKKLKKDSHA